MVPTGSPTFKAGRAQSVSQAAEMEAQGPFPQRLAHWTGTPQADWVQVLLVPVGAAAAVRVMRQLAELRVVQAGLAARFTALPNLLVTQPGQAVAGDPEDMTAVQEVAVQAADSLQSSVVCQLA